MRSSETRTRDRSSPRPAVIVGLLLALFGNEIVGQLNLSTRLGTSQVGGYLLSDAIKWVIVGVLLAIVLVWERRSLASIGLEMPGGREIGLAVAAGLLAVVLGVFLTGLAVAALGVEQPAALSAVGRLPFLIQVMVVVTAVITEEIMWRGYPIERLAELTGRPWVGAVVSGVVFLAVHYPDWGLAGAIPQSVFTLALVGVYVWSRNVVTSMVTHGVINVLMVLVLPQLI